MVFIDLPIPSHVSGPEKYKSEFQVIEANHKAV